ncbi:MAG: hypothetical protein ACP5TI_03345 [Thermoprotei archaeon]
MKDRFDFFLAYLVTIVGTVATQFFLKLREIHSVRTLLLGIIFIVVLLFGTTFAGLMFALSFVFGLWFLSKVGGAVAVVLMFVLWAYALFEGQIKEGRKPGLIQRRINFR